MTATVLTGVSRGLGRALFDELYRRGDRLLAVGRGFTAEQRAADPHRVTLAAVDLSRPDLPVPGLAEFLRAGPAGEDVVLIHNAGSVEPIGPIGALDPARTAATVHVNLLAPMLLTNAVLAAAGTAPTTVLFVSSGAAHRVIDGWATYCATKAGGEMFFAALAEQYADDDRVRVATVNPGVMDTDMQALIRDSDFAGVQRYRGLAERGELPSPADVARRIVAEHLT